MRAQSTRLPLPDIEPLRGVYRPLTDSMLLAETFAKAQIPAPALVLDLCCGSGIQGISAAMLGHHVDAVDSEREAVTNARRNALLNKVDVAVYQGDLFEPVAGRTYDAILTNPPYLPTPDRGRRTHTWCDGGPDGRAVIDRICTEAPHHLAPGGSLWMVHSSIADVPTSIDMLECAGLNVEIVTEHREPFGPVTTDRLEYLKRGGFIDERQQDEVLVVLHANGAGD